MQTVNTKKKKEQQKRHAKGNANEDGGGAQRWSSFSGVVNHISRCPKSERTTAGTTAGTLKDHRPAHAFCIDSILALSCAMAGSLESICIARRTSASARGRSLSSTYAVAWIGAACQ